MQSPSARERKLLTRIAVSGSRAVLCSTLQKNSPGQGPALGVLGEISAIFPFLLTRVTCPLVPSFIRILTKTYYLGHLFVSSFYHQVVVEDVVFQSS